MEYKVTVDEWITRFRTVGLNEKSMRDWHTLFEKENPEGHQSFLEWLGVPPGKAAEIRGRKI